MGILSARSWVAIFAETEAPLTWGWPILGEASPPSMSTSLKVISLPGSPASFSTRRRWPSITRYCFPPVLITAYMALLAAPSLGRVADYTQGRPLFKVIEASGERELVVLHVDLNDL